MRLIVLTSIGFFLASFVFSQANENANQLINTCVLAESILVEFKSASNTNVITEGSVRNKLQAQKTGDILDDISTYADTFEHWATQSVPDFSEQFKQNKDRIDKNTSITEKEKSFKLDWLSHDLFDQYSYPVNRYGSIIGIEMFELATRYETNAMPYLRRVAETKLPRQLGVPACARIKNHYQNPAADAWMMLSVPEGLTDDEKKAWLINFMANEKGKGQGGKGWAVEAAERMIKRIDDPSKAILAP